MPRYVNEAKRLSDLNKSVPTYNIFVSESTVAALDDAERWPLLPLGAFNLQGKRAAHSVYALAHAFHATVAQ